MPYVQFHWCKIPNCEFLTRYVSGVSSWCNCSVPLLQRGTRSEPINMEVFVPCSRSSGEAGEDGGRVRGRLGRDLGGGAMPHE